MELKFERYDEILSELEQAIDNGRRVELMLENAGVFTNGKDCWLSSKLSIRIDGDEIFMEIDNVKSGTMWYSNYTGSWVEELYNRLSDDLYDYCYNLAMEEAKKYGLSEDDIWVFGEHDIVFEKDNKTYVVIFGDYYERHYIGRHIFVSEFYKPEVQILE